MVLLNGCAGRRIDRVVRDSVAVVQEVRTHVSGNTTLAQPTPPVTNDNTSYVVSIVSIESSVSAPCTCPTRTFRGRWLAAESNHTSTWTSPPHPEIRATAWLPRFG